MLSIIHSLSSSAMLADAGEQTYGHGDDSDPSGPAPRQLGHTQPRQTDRDVEGALPHGHVVMSPSRMCASFRPETSRRNAKS